MTLPCGLMLWYEHSNQVKETMHKTGSPRLFVFRRLATRFVGLIIAALVAAIIVGCAKLGYLTNAVFSPPDDYTISLLGEDRLVYTFDSGETSPHSLFFFITGSGCHSYRYYLNSYLEDLGPGYRVLALQKKHLKGMASGRKCPRAFHEYNTWPNWIKDQSAFVKTVLKQTSFTPKHVVIMGVSEGADTAMMVAKNVPEITHVVLIAGGIEDPNAGPWGSFEKMYPMIDWQKVERARAADPQSIDKTILGHPFRYWSGFRAHKDPLADYLSVKVPILMAHGEKDSNALLENAGRMEAEFKKANKRNLTLLVYPNSDHQLKEPNGKSHRPEFLRHVTKWVAQSKVTSAEGI